MVINDAKTACKQLSIISDLFKTGEITEKDFEEFRSAMEQHCQIMEEIALAKNRRISDCKDRVKSLVGAFKLKNTEVTKFKAAILKAMEILQ